MELEGMYAAARTRRRIYPILVSKGISDIVGFDRDDAWTKYACETAASGALALLALRPVEPRDKPDLVSPPAANSRVERSDQEPDGHLSESDDVVLPMTSIYAIDEEALESAIRRFGLEWPRPKVVWPSYSDRLIALIRDTIHKFDEEATNFAGSDYFIQNAPRALASVTHNRDEIQKRMPIMVRRLSGMQSSSVKEAIRAYLLLANNNIHNTLGYLSSWEAIRKLGRSFCF
jgi:hypothetical protein